MISGILDSVFLLIVWRMKVKLLIWVFVYVCYWGINNVVIIKDSCNDYFFLNSLFLEIVSLKVVLGSLEIILILFF